MKHSREYASWSNMRARCRNPKNKAFRYYGGRGIQVKFKNFEEFFEYLGYCLPNKSLDRINNNGHYEKGNVRWADKKTQMSNRSDNRTLTHDGKTLTLAQWGREKGLSLSTIWARLHYGWSIPQTLDTPLLSIYEISRRGTKARFGK